VQLALLARPSDQVTESHWRRLCEAKPHVHVCDPMLLFRGSRKWHGKAVVVSIGNGGGQRKFWEQTKAVLEGCHHASLTLTASQHIPRTAKVNSKQPGRHRAHKQRTTGKTLTTTAQIARQSARSRPFVCDYLAGALPGPQNGKHEGTHALEVGVVSL
jgi:hypothetical protein